MNTCMTFVFLSNCFLTGAMWGRVEGVGRWEGVLLVS